MFKRVSKYRNHKTVVDGITFDSKKEARRYAELKLRQRAGQISDLRLQPRFPLHSNGVKVCDMVLDFEYVEKGVLVLEDVKSPATAKNPTYRLKKKMFEAEYDRQVMEV